MKKQTLILVVIGVILFVAGSAIAYASVQGAKKNIDFAEHRCSSERLDCRRQVEHPGRHDGPGR